MLARVKIFRPKNAKIAEIAETEKVRFLETFEIWAFFGKIDKLYEKSFNFIQNL